MLVSLSIAAHRGGPGAPGGAGNLPHPRPPGSLPTPLPFPFLHAAKAAGFPPSIAAAAAAAAAASNGCGLPPGFGNRLPPGFPNHAGGMMPGLPTRPCLPCPPGMGGSPHSMQGLGGPQTSPRSNNPYSDEPMSPNGKKNLFSLQNVYLVHIFLYYEILVRKFSITL